jgi:hypothetical protein
MTKSFVISCEYATCAIPEAYRELYQEVEELVTSPAGWDSGALNLAQAFAMRLRTQLIHGNHTRLLLDLDRDGEDRWSPYSIRIPEATRLRLADREDGTYRTLLRQRIADDLRRHDVVCHISVRTIEDGDGRVVVESFDPGGFGEALADAWRTRLLQAGLDATHCSAAGTSALAAELGGMFPREQYGFVRIKVAQSYFLEGRPLKWETAKRVLIDALQAAADDCEEHFIPEPEPEPADAPADSPDLPEPESFIKAADEPAAGIQPRSGKEIQPEPEDSDLPKVEPSGQGLLF